MKVASEPSVSQRAPRAVITGIGVVSPVGIGISSFWKSLMAGAKGLDRISAFDPASFPSQLAAEVRGWKPETWLTERQVKHQGRATQFACVAAQLALDDSGLTLDVYRTDVITGSGFISFDILEKEIEKSPSSMLDFIPGVTDPLGMMKTSANAPATAISLMLQTEGLVTTVSNGCSSALMALSFGAERVRSNQADAVICGGVDTPVTRMVLNAHCSARMLTENKDRDSALMPFDRRRTKPALGEGAAFFIVEDRESAIARRARIYAEVGCFAQQSENVNEIFLMDRTGERWAGTIRKAIQSEEAGSSVDHVNAHGPSDRNIDKIEAAALRLSMGAKAGDVPVTSIKGSVGSGMTSAAALQIAAAAMSIYTGEIPPTVNYSEPDPDCNLNVVSIPRRGVQINKALVNAHALGGINSALILRRS